MKICVDTHTHSIASGHAYSTIDELARSARKKRLKGFVLTEHGPAMQGFPHEYYFANIHILPQYLYNVRLFRGVELNIIDGQGGIDLRDKYIRTLDFVMAGLHEACLPPQSQAEDTKALIAAIANPLVDAISHPGNPAYPVDIEEVVKAAVYYEKALEINNGSFKVRKGSEPNCRAVARFARLCGALLCCGSDAHYSADVGDFKIASALLKEEQVHEEQIINSDYKRFVNFCEKRQIERRAV